jgi:hypothetical protein
LNLGILTRLAGLWAVKPLNVCRVDASYSPDALYTGYLA